MSQTIDDLPTGDRLDLVVEFISARTYRCGDSQLSRLHVTDKDGSRFDILGSSEAVTVQGLKSGETYRLSGLLVAAPPSLSPTGEECPDCGGPLRPGDTVDAVGPALTQAAIQLDLEERFGIIDTGTVIRPSQPDEARIEDLSPVPESTGVRSPEYVCRSCGSYVWGTEFGTVSVPDLRYVDTSRPNTRR